MAGSTHACTLLRGSQKLNGSPRVKRETHVDRDPATSCQDRKTFTGAMERTEHPPAGIVSNCGGEQRAELLPTCRQGASRGQSCSPRADRERPRVGCPRRNAGDRKVRAQRCICESYCTRLTHVASSTCGSQACSYAPGSLRPSRGPTGSRLLSEQHWWPPSCPFSYE